MVETHQEKRTFQAEVQQLLRIVTHALYSNDDIVIRELNSNASDAIDKLRFLALSDPALLEESGEFAIRIFINKEERTLTISDNGIGMDRAEVDENLGKIAQSGTREFLSHLTGDQKKDANLIGQFGVGFYSAFMIADKVEVITRRAGLSKEHGVHWESTGNGEYIIQNTHKETQGTDVILHLKSSEDATEKNKFLEHWQLRSIINKYSDYLSIPIKMHKLSENGKEETDTLETVNRVTALWVLPKKEISKEQYQEFYKHISHDFEVPLAWAHHKVEGSDPEYICVLFLPAHVPFNFWQHDKQYGLKLYVQRVFIMDQVQQFMPHYLRFVRGIVDTSALSLNISREILQDHPVLSKLRTALTRRVLDLLEYLAKNDSEKYTKFWQEFGVVLKEGPAEDFSNRDRIAKLLRFSTTHTDTIAQTVTLEEYVQRMPAMQKKIYYITAESFNAAKASPHLEVFRKKNIEVLLLSDRIDEWLVGHLNEFNGKPLQSVAKGELDLTELTAEEEAPKDEQTKQEEEQHEKQQKAIFSELLKKIQTVLAHQIKEVRLSHRLITSPACLVRDANALGPQMERLLKAAGQEVTESKPILELNPNHKIIAQLQKENNNERQEEWIYILYEEALLAEGSSLKDPALFVERINKLWMEIIH